MKFTHAIFTAVLAMAVTTSARPSNVGEYTAPQVKDYRPDVGVDTDGEQHVDLTKRGGSRVTVKSKYFPVSPIGGPNPEEDTIIFDDDTDTTDLAKRGGSRVTVKSKYFPVSPIGGPNAESVFSDNDDGEEEKEIEKRGWSRVSVKSKYFPVSAIGGPRADVDVDGADVEQ